MLTFLMRGEYAKKGRKEIKWSVVTGSFQRL